MEFRLHLIILCPTNINSQHARRVGNYYYYFNCQTQNDFTTSMYLEDVYLTSNILNCQKNKMKKIVHGSRGTYVLTSKKISKFNMAGVLKYPVVTNKVLNNLSFFVQFYWSDNKYWIVCYSYRNDFDCLKLITNNYFIMKNSNIITYISNLKTDAELKYVRS